MDPDEKPKKTRTKKNALETAAVMLGARAYTRLELRRKLYRKEKFEPAEIERAVRELERMGFLSDRQYAEDAVRILRDRGFGPLRIRTRLLTKGIDRELLDEVMADAGGNGDAAFGPDDMARAVGILRKNARRFAKDEPQRRHVRALRLLAGRGFPAGIAYPAVDQWEKGDQE